MAFYPRKRNNRVRRYKRRPRYRKSNRLMVRRRNVTGLGNKLAIKFRYSDILSLDPVAGGFALHVYRASSIFDPDFTSAGHQVMQYDSIAPLYDHWCVIWSKITVQGRGSDNAPGTIAVSVQDDSATLTSMNQYMESRNRVYKVTSLSGGPVVNLSKSYTPKKFLSIPHPLSEKDLQGTLAGNPAENAFYHVVYAGNNASEFTAISMCITIEYMVIFSEPVTPALS